MKRRAVADERQAYVYVTSWGKSDSGVLGERERERQREGEPDRAPSAPRSSLSLSSLLSHEQTTGQ